MKWKGVLGLAVTAVVVTVVVTGCAAAGSSPAVPARNTVPARTSAPAGNPVTAPSPAPAAAGTGPATPWPTTSEALPVAPAGDGTRPQTRVMPATATAAFRALVNDLWLSVTTGNPGYGLPAFFPETAYTQVKAIGDPQYDWQTRLWHEYTIDVAAAHQVVGDDAQLVGVVVPTQYALWVPVGACHNNIGYWHVPGARVEYQKDGQLRSFGIASMISWRGVWYVVHFGGVKRDGAGMIDEPVLGVGTPGPPGGC